MSLSELFSMNNSSNVIHNNNEEPLEGGTEKPDWVVGRIYADWCGHCVNMKEDWEKIKKKMENGKVKFLDIEEKEKGTKIPNMNNTYFRRKELVKSSGYPTIFMFQVKNPKGTLQYYTGGRTYDLMKGWIKEMSKRKGGGKSRKTVKRGYRKMVKTQRRYKKKRV
jgi:thiol-disulfide isomerase/thioredoxin